MFELGKKYHKIYHKPNPRPMIMECVVASEHQYCLKGDGGLLLLRFDTDFRDYVEYKEPIKIVRYFNVYPEGQSAATYSTRAHADTASAAGRIACKRVEFTEGEFDE